MDDSDDVKAGRCSKCAKILNIPAKSNDEITPKKCTKRAIKQPLKPIIISNEKNKTICKKNPQVLEQDTA